MQRAVAELLAMLQAAAQEVAPDTAWDEQVAETFRRHHSHLMYQALLAATKSSFLSMKMRLGSRVRCLRRCVRYPIATADPQTLDGHWLDVCTANGCHGTPHALLICLPVTCC